MRPCPRVRLLIALSLLALTVAGCTAPEEENPNPLFGSCPQWIEGDLQETSTLNFEGEDQSTVFPGSESLDDFQGFPLDRYTIYLRNVSLEGGIEVRAFADGADRRLAFTDYRDPQDPHLLPFVKLDDNSEVEFDVFLTAVAHGTAPAPDALRLVWSGEGRGQLEMEIRASYRVCGVPV